MRLPPHILLTSWLICAMAAIWPQVTHPQLPQPPQAPKIDKIDPPNWFAVLPDPMLLVHGESLNGARFTLNGEGVSLERTQASENGHWAFLWLKTANAEPQTLWIIATNDGGQARQAFQLAERSHDPDAHRGFSSADVLYLIMTDRFADGSPARQRAGLNRAAARGWHGGDFAGIEQHLDYLRELGVTALWITPVASNGAMPESYHGYAATDLYAVDAHFGSIEDYRRLSDALHARGMKLVIDLVPSHIGVQHPWVLDPPAPDWFHGTLENHRTAQHDFYELVDPHAPPQAWSAITTGWFTDAMPDLNQENPLVSRYLIQDALWWIETVNLDDIRLDTFPYVGRAFWQAYHEALHSIYPHLATAGEIFHRDPEVTSFFAGGVAHGGIDTGLDTPLDFPLYFALRDVLAHSRPMTNLAKVLRQDALYPHPERLITFIGNHDTTRFFTEVAGSVPKLKLAMGLILTLRGMPQIYSGDEIGMAGREDPDNRRDFPGGFAADTHSALNRPSRTATEEEVFSWTSGLLKLRAEYPALQTGIEQNLFANEDFFAFSRSTDGSGCSTDHSKQTFLIAVNKARQSRVLDLPVDETALSKCTQFRPLAPTAGAVPELNGGKLQIEEAAESMTIYELR